MDTYLDDVPSAIEAPLNPPQRTSVGIPTDYSEQHLPNSRLCSPFDAQHPQRNPPTRPLLPMALNTKYSAEHLPQKVFCSADFASQVGAVVINENGHALAFRDPETGALQLPISDVSLHLEGLVQAPLKFVEEETGLKIERLPLRQANKRYRNPDAFRWECVDEDLIFKDDTISTTNPFSVGLDLAWYNEGTSHSLRQAVILWYGGVVQGQPGLRANQCFMPVRDLLLRMRNQWPSPTVHIRALSFFEELWHATEGN